MGTGSRKQKLILFLLFFLLLICGCLSARYGAVPLTMSEIINAICNFFAAPEQMTLNERIFMEIRLPRALMSIFVGAGLAVGGVLMQAIFRNPIVEPGLIGTSSGAAFGAALYFVLGSALNLNAGEWTLPIAACLGGIISTALVYFLAGAKNGVDSNVIRLLLSGIAINALFLSGVGFLSYIARDPQARSITFWNLGTLSGSNWTAVIINGSITIFCIFSALRFAKPLNALMLGESEAQLLGTNIQKLKFYVLLLNVVMVAVATAFVGIISFIGLIVPHLLRLTGGADNRFLIVSGCLMGGVLLSIADLISRIILRPAELPIGVVTSVIGVPVFLILLRRNSYLF